MTTIRKGRSSRPMWTDPLVCGILSVAYQQVYKVCKSWRFKTNLTSNGQQNVSQRRGVYGKPNTNLQYILPQAGTVYPQESGTNIQMMFQVDHRLPVASFPNIILVQTIEVIWP